MFTGMLTGMLTEPPPALALARRKIYQPHIAGGNAIIIDVNSADAVHRFVTVFRFHAACFTNRLALTYNEEVKRGLFVGSNII
jgi:hypothetical protein